ncbi:hypothetical protein ACFQQB_31465 [Nonomuraea rubra]|uniref:hypothetical protein n=1 Tax=Nonomuraea rubra TaxID=46180 RepID=UPI0036092586
MASLTERVASVKAWGRVKLDHWRVRRLSLDHLVRAAQRYQLQSGDRLAGAVTYFAFLSFFPCWCWGTRCSASWWPPARPPARR